MVLNYTDFNETDGKVTFRDNQLSLLLGMADTIHDFWKGRGSYLKSDENEIRNIIQSKLFNKIYNGLTSVGNVDPSTFLTSKIKCNNHSISASSVEEATMEFIESSSILAKYSRKAELTYKQFLDTDEAEFENYDILEINDVEGDTTNGFNEKHLKDYGNRICNFFGRPHLFLTYDAGQSTMTKIVSVTDRMRRLYTPQNIADSAGTKPGKDEDKDVFKFPTSNVGNPEYFVGNSNFYTKKDYMFVYKNEEFGLTNYHGFNLKIMSPPDPSRILSPISSSESISYVGGNGPSVNYLWSFLLDPTKPLSNESKIANVYDALKPLFGGGNYNNIPNEAALFKLQRLLFDFKREGDYGQIEACRAFNYFSEEETERGNGVLVTIDRLCALKSRLRGLNTILTNGKKLTLYKIGIPRTREETFRDYIDSNRKIFLDVNNNYEDRAQKIQFLIQQFTNLNQQINMYGNISGTLLNEKCKESIKYLEGLKSLYTYIYGISVLQSGNDQIKNAFISETIKNQRLNVCKKIIIKSLNILLLVLNSTPDLDVERRKKYINATTYIISMLDSIPIYDERFIGFFTEYSSEIPDSYLNSVKDGINQMSDVDAIKISIKSEKEEIIRNLKSIDMNDDTIRQIVGDVGDVVPPILLSGINIFKPANILGIFSGIYIQNPITKEFIDREAERISYFSTKELYGCIITRNEEIIDSLLEMQGSALTQQVLTDAITKLNLFLKLNKTIIGNNTMSFRNLLNILGIEMPANIDQMPEYQTIVEQYRTIVSTIIQKQDFNVDTALIEELSNIGPTISVSIVNQIDNTPDLLLSKILVIINLLIQINYLHKDYKTAISTGAFPDNIIPNDTFIQFIQNFIGYIKNYFIEKYQKKLLSEREIYLHSLIVLKNESPQLKSTGDLMGAINLLQYGGVLQEIFNDTPAGSQATLLINSSPILLYFYKILLNTLVDMIFNPVYPAINNPFLVTNQDFIKIDKELNSLTDGNITQISFLNFKLSDYTNLQSISQRLISILNPPNISSDFLKDMIDYNNQLDVIKDTIQNTNEVVPTIPNITELNDQNSNYSHYVNIDTSNITTHTINVLRQTGSDNPFERNIKAINKYMNDRQFLNLPNNAGITRPGKTDPMNPFAIFGNPEYTDLLYRIYQIKHGSDSTNDKIKLSYWMPPTNRLFLNINTAVSWNTYTIGSFIGDLQLLHLNNKYMNDNIISNLYKPENITKNINTINMSNISSYGIAIERGTQEYILAIKSFFGYSTYLKDMYEWLDAKRNTVYAAIKDAKKGKKNPTICSHFVMTYRLLSFSMYLTLWEISKYYNNMVTNDNMKSFKGFQFHIYTDELEEYPGKYCIRTEADIFYWLCNIVYPFISDYCTDVLITKKTKDTPKNPVINPTKCILFDNAKSNRQDYNLLLNPTPTTKPLISDIFTTEFIDIQITNNLIFSEHINKPTSSINKIIAFPQPIPLQLGGDPTKRTPVKQQKNLNYVSQLRGREEEFLGRVRNERGKRIESRRAEKEDLRIRAIYLPIIEKFYDFISNISGIMNTILFEQMEKVFNHVVTFDPRVLNPYYIDYYIRTIDKINRSGIGLEKIQRISNEMKFVIQSNALYNKIIDYTVNNAPIKSVIIDSYAILVKTLASLKRYLDKKDELYLFEYSSLDTYIQNPQLLSDINSTKISRYYSIISADGGKIYTHLLNYLYLYLLTGINTEFSDWIKSFKNFVSDSGNTITSFKKLNNKMMKYLNNPYINNPIEIIIHFCYLNDALMKKTGNYFYSQDKNAFLNKFSTSIIELTFIPNLSNIFQFKYASGILEYKVIGGELIKRQHFYETNDEGGINNSNSSSSSLSSSLSSSSSGKNAAGPFSRILERSTTGAHLMPAQYQTLQSGAALPASSIPFRGGDPTQSQKEIQPDEIIISNPEQSKDEVKSDELVESEPEQSEEEVEPDEIIKSEQGSEQFQDELIELNPLEYKIYDEIYDDTQNIILLPNFYPYCEDLSGILFVLDIIQSCDDSLNLRYTLKTNQSESIISTVAETEKTKPSILNTVTEAVSNVTSAILGKNQPKTTKTINTKKLTLEQKHAGLKQKLQPPKKFEARQLQQKLNSPNFHFNPEQRVISQAIPAAAGGARALRKTRRKVKMTQQKQKKWKAIKQTKQQMKRVYQRATRHRRKQ